MRRYMARQPVTVPANTRIGLTSAQAERRARTVSQTDKRGIYITLFPTQFRKGETFIADGRNLKRILGSLDELSSPKTKKTADVTA